MKGWGQAPRRVSHPFLLQNVAGEVAKGVGLPEWLNVAKP